MLNRTRRFIREHPDLSLLLVLLSVVGLIVDFNRTPTPMVESHDPADEFDLPDEVLTGQPPAVDAASGKIDDEKK